jgi:CHAT domain-containing protein
VGAEQTLVWAVSQRDGVAFASAPIGASAIGTKIARLRQSLDPRVETFGEIPAFDVATAYELYRLLLEPVRTGWEGAKTLLVVADGPLGQVPFALLPTGPVALAPGPPPLFSSYRSVPWLIRRYAVTTLPSVSALATLRRTPPGGVDRRPFVGFGDPYFSVEQARQATAERVGGVSPGEPATRTFRFASRNVVVSPPANVETSTLAMLPRLPDTADEIRGMATAMRADLTRDMFLGESANEQMVKKLDLTKYRVIAFATHGLVPGDLDGLTQPALALTAPDVAKVAGDGLLTMEKILGLRLDADWVVLSACNTANGAGTGAEAISGLGRAFFYAGARSLLVTHWPVETRSARTLTTHLFDRQVADPSLSRARALQQTMNALIDDGGVIDPQTGRLAVSYAHPIFWAPFALIGDGG